MMVSIPFKSLLLLPVEAIKHNGLKCLDPFILDVIRSAFVITVRCELNGLIFQFLFVLLSGIEPDQRSV
jgi:hypothetical protein